jgi:hypothetical protein
MADSKISALPAASAAAAANEFAINEAGISKKLTAAQLAEFLGVIKKRLGTQFDSSSTTPAKVTNLDQTLGVGTWIVEYYLRWRSSAAATGVKFDLNHSGTVTSFVWWQRQFDISATASTAVPDQDAIQAAGHVHMGFASRAKGTAGRGVLLSADTVNLDMFTVIEALIEVTVSGDIQLYFGSEATGSTQSLMVGSVLRATKVA